MMSGQSPKHIRVSHSQVKTPAANLTATCVSAAPDGTVAALDTGGNLWQSINSTAPWLVATRYPVFVNISASSGGNLFGVDGQGNLWKYAGPGTWTEIGPIGGASTLATVSAGNLRNIWGTDTQGNVYQYQLKLNQWNPISAATLTRQVCATSDNNVFRLDTNGDVFEYASAAWTQIPTSFQISILSGGAAGWLWGISQASSRIYQYDGPDRGWLYTPGPIGETPTAISCGDDGTVWVLGNSGTLYELQVGGTWLPLPAAGTVNPNLISVGSITSAWIVDVSNVVYQYVAFADIFASAGLAQTLAQISCASGTSIWGIDGNGISYQLARNDGVWTATPVPADQTWIWISASGDGAVWAVSTGNQVYQYQTSSWGQVTAPALTQISVASGGVVFGISNGHIVRYDAETGKWPALADAGDSLFVSLSAIPGGQVYAVDSSSLVWIHFDSWLPCGRDLLQISGGNTPANFSLNVWGIDKSSQMAVQLSSPTGWVKQPPPAGPGPLWDTQSIFEETQSTHLWLVNRAAQLAQSQGQIGQFIHVLINPFAGQLDDAPFHNNICQGLYDADYLDRFSSPKWVSHFYDPDTKTNWQNEDNPTALSQGSRWFLTAVAMYKRRPPSLQNAGYYLGVSLHYMTDLTQPMHASNYTYFSSWLYGYHTDFEEYAMEYQSQCAAPTSYVANQWLDPGAYLIQIAKDSNRKYAAKIVPDGRYGVRFKDKYKKVARTYLPAIFNDAITGTSQYLVAWMQRAVMPSAQTWNMSQGDRYLQGLDFDSNGCAGTLVRATTTTGVGLVRYISEIGLMTTWNTYDTIPGTNATLWIVSTGDRYLDAGNVSSDRMPKLLVQSTTTDIPKLGLLQYDPVALGPTVVWFTSDIIRGIVDGNWTMSLNDYYLAVGSLYSDKASILVQNTDLDTTPKLGLINADQTHINLWVTWTATLVIPGVGDISWDMHLDDQYLCADDLDGDSHHEILVRSTYYPGNTYLGLLKYQPSVHGLQVMWIQENTIPSVSDGASWNMNQSDRWLNVGNVDGGGRPVMLVQSTVASGHTYLGLLKYDKSAQSLRAYCVQEDTIPGSRRASAWTMRTSDVYFSVGDVDGDGRKEILVQSTDPDSSPSLALLKCDDASDGFEVMWQTVNTIPGQQPNIQWLMSLSDQYVGLGDIEGDGQCQILVQSTYSGTPYLGVLRWIDKTLRVVFIGQNTIPGL